ncbi:DUF2157 domain-containing protein [Aestuariibacter halophilus]|uniref:DUF2157 domain-containing protein n=1 Tax=Fluctibacter halophilus TaxID=226011 RepID=A0ABS8GCK7_9ALTE|nr:DUF2157 domain-containing protein [Aestuariibacter halophilus]MCC2618292.1 DUF2157 domain-containing protein [Aestuariibacter halophilus]
MKITRNHLDSAASDNIITPEQADALYDYLKEHSGATPSFTFTHVLYYFGGLIAIGAMTVFMTLGWEVFGGWGIVSCSMIYAVLGVWLTHRFATDGHPIPAGICATFVIALTPLAIYGLQQGLGIWPDERVYREYHRIIEWHWLYMELGALTVGIIMAWRYRYPFMLMPIAVTLWYLSMDVAVMLTGEHYNVEFRAFISMYCGLLITLLAFWVDIRSRSQADFAFWLYLFGLLAFWGGMTAQDSDSELAKLGYFAVNLLLMAIGVLLTRRVFVVFGALGSCLYLGHLAHDVFKDSWMFPISLTFIGLMMVYGGVQWQKHEKRLSQKARSTLPPSLTRLINSGKQR